MKFARFAFAALVAVGLLTAAVQADAHPISLPQVNGINANDLFPDIVNGQPNLPSRYAPATLFGNYAFTQVGSGGDANALIGGDFTQNLFQRGTSVGSITTSVTYTADRWFAWSGSATTLTVTQQTGASDIVAGVSGSLRVNKGSGAGVVQSCIAQAVETANAYRFQGQTAEFDFSAKAGAGFSAASSNLNVYIITGTGSDEGSVKLAYGLNAGGGGSSGWTGQANAASAVAVALSSGGFNRYTVTGKIPATATEIAVAICYTPVGTGTATDWFEFADAQLVINPAFTAYTAATGTGFVNDLRAKAMTRRSFGIEAALQYRYYFKITETATQILASGVATASAVERAVMSLPAIMRTTPTCTITAGGYKWIGKSTGAVSAPGCAGVTSAVGTILYVSDTESGNSAGDAMLLQGTATTGSIVISAEL